MRVASAPSATLAISRGAVEDFMLRGLSRMAQRLLRDFKPPFAREMLPAILEPEETRSSVGRLEKLERVVLTDGVGRTLFEEFARHQQSDRGHEETGWLLLGLRRETEALVLATLPAGASRDAGVAHVRFNSAAQMVASRILRQQERQLSILGVVHTHPGTLRHPSEGDYAGDSLWVHQLRGREGVFGIGTLEKDDVGPPWLVERPRAHIQRQGKRRFTWYVLAAGDLGYRTIPVEFTLGPDLGLAAHSAWPTIERHADALERICRQQARVTLKPGDQYAASLTVRVPLAEPGDAIELELVGDKAAFFVIQGNSTHVVDPKEQLIDRGLYLILAELAARAANE